MNYFPYQVLIDLNSFGSSKLNIFFKNREEKPLIRQQGLEKNKIYKAETSDVDLEEGSVIDSVFAEHMNELKHQALSNKGLSFGADQPSMKSAYRAMVGYCLFILCSIIFNLVLDYSQYEYEKAIVAGWQRIFLIIALLAVLILIKIVVVNLFLVKNLTETIYVKNLYFRVIYLPYIQLSLIFANIYLILKTSYLALLLFFVYLFLFLFILLIVYKVFLRFLNAKKNEFKLEFKVHHNSNDSNLNIFTINSSEN